MKYKFASIRPCDDVGLDSSTFAATIHARWNDLCQVARRSTALVTTSDGQTVSGACTSTDADGLSLNCQSTDRQNCTRHV